MVIGRRKRILAAIFFPITVVPFCLFSYGIFLSDEPKIALQVSGFILFFAFIFMGIPSILYALLMEYLVNPRCKSNLVVVVLSILFGILAASIIDRRDFYYIGAFVGLFMGIYLRYDFVKCSKL